MDCGGSRIVRLLLFSRAAAMAGVTARGDKGRFDGNSTTRLLLEDGTGEPNPRNLNFLAPQTTFLSRKGRARPNCPVTAIEWHACQRTNYRRTHRTTQKEKSHQGPP